MHTAPPLECRDSLSAATLAAPMRLSQVPWVCARPAVRVVQAQVRIACTDLRGTRRMSEVMPWLGGSTTKDGPTDD